MIKLILPSQSRAQTANNDRKVDRRLCLLLLRHYIFTPSKDAKVEMARKPREPGT